MSGLDFSTFRHANVMRCVESFHPIASWSPTDWANAMAGECGEACNIVKKIRRLQTYGDVLPHSTPGYVQLRIALAKELADTVTYADLLAARLGINLGMAVANKFNEVSDRVGSNIKLPS